MTTHGGIVPDRLVDFATAVYAASGVPQDDA
jgi:hypothetical protein